MVVTMSEIVMKSPKPLGYNLSPKRPSNKKDKLWRLAIALAITKNLHHKINHKQKPWKQQNPEKSPFKNSYKRNLGMSLKLPSVVSVWIVEINRNAMNSWRKSSIINLVFWVCFCMRSHFKNRGVVYAVCSLNLYLWLGRWENHAIQVVFKTVSSIYFL